MKHLVRSVLAVFAIVLIMDASALCQAKPSTSRQTQNDNRESEPAKESSTEGKLTVGPEKKLTDPVINFAGVPIQLNKHAVASLDPNTRVLASGTTAQSQTQPPASSQAQAPQAAPAQGAEESADLAKQLSNPIASLVSLPFQMNWDTSVGPERKTRATLNIQPVMPFKLNQDWNLIVRIIMPLVSQPPLVPGGETKFGLSDFLVSGFLSPAKPKGFIWGIGPAILVPMTSEPTLGTEKFAIGPTVIVLKQVGGTTIGLLANHLWSVLGDDKRPKVNQTFIQPFVSYTTKTAWTFSLNTETAINWEAKDGEGVTAPVHFGITKLVRIGSQPLSVGPTVGYYVDQPGIGPKWRARFSLTLLFPIKK